MSVITNFKCKKCGNCCKMGFVYITKNDIENISLFLKVNIKELIKKYTENILWLGRILKFKDDKCVFLNKDNLCSIYDARPSQCRTFPHWEWIVKKKNWQEEISGFCKGI